jgi:hypothetical protein
MQSSNRNPYPYLTFSPTFARPFFVNADDVGGVGYRRRRRIDDDR